MIFSKIHKKPIIVSSLVIVLVATLGISLFYKIKKADAVAINLAGRAQILNANGYLNFTDNSANVTTSNIGCQFDGYAWSSDIGWVAFGATDNPDGPVTCNLTTGILSGKARVINDGSIIDFNATPYNSNVRILSSGDFTGYAWSTSIGWINFTGVSAMGISLTGPEIPSTVTPGPGESPSATPTSTPISTATGSLSATVIPELPETGVSPIGKSNTQILIVAGIFVMTSLLFYLIRRKHKI